METHKKKRKKLVQLLMNIMNAILDMNLVMNLIQMNQIIMLITLKVNPIRKELILNPSYIFTTNFYLI